MNPTNNKKFSITAFFPAYNDDASIGLLVERAFEVLSRYTDDCEVVVVNDGSSDRTAEVLDGLARKEPRLRVIHHAVNQGYGGALRTGFQNATKDLVFYTDGDGQYDVEEISCLLPLMTEEIDVVNGYKLKRSDDRRRIVLGKIYQFLARQLFDLPIRDVDCDFRLMRRDAIQRIHLVSTSGVVCTEMIYKLHRSGCRFTETPVHHYPRLHGQSQFFTLPRVARTAYDFFLLWVKLVILRQGREGKWRVTRGSKTVASGEGREKHGRGANGEGREKQGRVASGEGREKQGRVASGEGREKQGRVASGEGRVESVES